MSSANAADRIHSAAIHLIRRVREVDEWMEITPARASALSVLVFGGPRTLTELAQAEQVTTATMSRLVSAMEAEGLVRRDPHADDARAVWLVPTAKARRILEKGRARRTELLDSLFAHLSPQEREVIRRAADLVDAAVLPL
jgi:DNA-binding MarR family transcriptional regulator